MAGARRVAAELDRGGILGSHLRINLGPNTRTWKAEDFVGGQVPTHLDGVGVTVNSKPAAVYYISPTQLNVELPPDVSGQAQLTVNNGAGSVSTPVNVKSVQPGLFLFAQGHVAAVRGGTYIGPPGLIDGVATVPAKLGDQIMLFGTGFGPTSPAIAA